MADDPYKAPTSDLAGAADPVDARSVAAGNGWQWIVAGWGYFRRAPLLWIGMVVVMMIVYFVIGVIPLVSLLLLIIGPVFTAGFMMGCAALDRDEELEFGHLFAAFSGYFGKLAIVGLIYFGAVMVITVVTAGLGVGLMSAGEGDPGIGVLLVVLVAMALAIPVVMAYWFAPALVVLDGMSPVDAMKASLSGCLRNIVPFLLYGLAAMVLMILAMIPAGLGFLVLGPVLIASIYSSYRDVFHNA